MKIFTGKLLVLCVGLLLVGTWGILLLQRRGIRNQGSITHGNHWCVQEEDCIQEAVFRYQIQNPEGHRSWDLFFLAASERNDPNDEVLKRLRNNSFRVRPVSESVDKHAVIKDKETDEAGVILTVGKVTWIGKTRVEVGLSAYSGFGDAKGYIFELARGEDGWTVKNRRFAFET
jgi:hypothetical protein